MGTTPHDALFKAVFEDPKIAAEHLAALLPPTVLRHLDLSRLKETRASFVDLELDAHHSDLLFEVPRPGGTQHIRVRDLGAKLPGWTGLLGEVLRSSGLEGLRLVLQYIVEASESIDQADLVRLARRAERGPREAIMPLADKLREEGREQGRQVMKSLAEKLREEGREEGLNEGQRKLLLKLLGLRFGPLPETVELRVRTARTAELSRWAERVLTAESIEEVLL